MDAISQAGQYGGYAAAFVMGVVTYFQTNALKQVTKKAEEEKGKAQEHIESAAVSRQFQEQARLMEEQSNAWRIRYDKASEEWGERYDKLRIELESTRERSGKMLEALTNCQEENASLKATRDLAPILEHIKTTSEDRKQTNEVLGKLFTILNEVQRTLVKFDTRLDQREPLQGSI